MKNTIDATMLKEAFLTGAKCIEAQKEEIDREMDAYFTEHPFSGDASKII